MLVLTRRIGEKVIIGRAGDQLSGPIEIQVLGITSNQVRYGIDAQRGIRVDREEVRTRIDKEEPAAKPTISSR